MKHQLFLAAAFGVLLGALSSLPFNAPANTSAVPEVPLSEVSAPADHVPEVFDFYLAALSQRYPIYFCLEGDGWSDRDHLVVSNAIIYGWWFQIDPYLAAEMREFCYSGLVTTHIRLEKLCEGAAACVEFASGYGGAWMWMPDEGGWNYRTATIWIDPAWWARATEYWKIILIEHEFGHVLSLNDTPIVAGGLTIMDYNWDEFRPTALDIKAVHDQYAGFELVAWERWREEHHW